MTDQELLLLAEVEAESTGEKYEFSYYKMILPVNYDIDRLSSLFGKPLRGGSIYDTFVVCAVDREIKFVVFRNRETYIYGDQ